MPTATKLLLLFILVAVAPVQTEPVPVAITLRQHAAFAPADIPFLIHVSTHPDNVMVCWAYEGEQSGSSCRTYLESDPNTIAVVLKHLPAGNYSLLAWVVRRGGKVYQVATTFEVLES